MSQPPALKVPTDGDRNQGPTVEVVTWVFTSIALITVLLRLFTRLRLTRNPGWDDFWIVIAMVNVTVPGSSPTETLTIPHLVFQFNLRHSRRDCGRKWQWQTPILPRAAPTIERHQVEQHRFYSGDLSILSPEAGRCNLIDTAAESWQSPESFHVLFVHHLHCFVLYMRRDALAAMQPT